MDRSKPVYRFGPFTLDAGRFELCRQGTRVRASGAQLELLLLFASRPGELVTREQIVAALWSEPEMVDVRQGINTAVARLRAVLNDDPSNPRYVETVVGKGYRFVAVIEFVAPSLSSSPEMVVKPSATSNVAAANQGHPFSPLAVEASNEVPIPSEQVHPDSPAVALDATKIISVSKPWFASGKIRFGALLAGAVLALALAMMFGVRSTRKTKLLQQVPEQIPGSAHQQVTTNDPEHPVSVASISPDGTLLAYADPSGIYIREMATGRTSLVPCPKLRATRLLWFPDQKRLLLTGMPFNADQSEIWILSSTGRAATLFRRDAGDGAPAPNGQSVAFTIDDGRQIQLANSDGTVERSVNHARDGEQLGKLFWSANGARISFEQRSAGEHPGTQIEFNYRWSYHSIEVATGRETAVASDISFDSAGETADGTVYYLRAHPAVDRVHNGMWMVATDRRTGAFVDEPKRLTAFGPYEVWTGMSVSRGGKITAIKEQEEQNIYYGKLSTSNKAVTEVQRVTTNMSTDCPHSWSPDGKVIYFESDRIGSMYHLFRQSIDSANADMLTVGEQPQFFPVLMADGNTLVYEDWKRKDEKYQHAIYRAQADGSGPKLVWNEDELDEWRCPTKIGASCVLRSTEGQRLFAFYALDLKSGKGRELAYTAWQPSLLGDWALSADGQTAAIPNHEAGAPTIRLLALDGSQKESVIKVRQRGQLWGLHWAPDGSGFFAQSRNGFSSSLQFITLKGDVNVMRETSGNTWGIPTSDGRNLAFVDSTVSRNVFLWR